MTYKGVVSQVDENTNEVTIAFDDFSVVKKFSQFMDMPVGIALHRWKEERSLAQNNFLWACIGDISKVTRNFDKWQIYLELLKRYGKFEHILILPEALEGLKKIYREIEELGDYKTQKGQMLRQVRVYYGSHTYNTEEMKNLLEGTLSEMAELGIKPRLSKEDKERYGL